MHVSSVIIYRERVFIDIYVIAVNLAQIHMSSLIIGFVKHLVI